ncbi:MAG TPA: AAA family ATPase [Pyrinomonadaceae bacterium]|jgi:hypothetical protein
MNEDRATPSPNTTDAPAATRAGTTPDWRAALNTWLAHNPKTMPDELRRLRDEFVHRFPKEKLLDLTLEEYAVGLGSRDSFCYWLEFGTKKLGHMAGYASKFGLRYEKDGWRWPKIYASAEDALARIKAGLVALIEAVEQGRFRELDEIGGGFGHGLRVKPLSLYFPDQFLPVWQPAHLAYFLSLFGVKADGDVLKRNLMLLHVLRGLPDFEGFDTMQMMRFLYQSFPPPDVPTGGGGTSIPLLPPTPVDVPPQIEALLDITERTRNILLYGPPGVGKTWLVNHFTNYFLLHHNVSPEAARAYWQAKGSADARKLQAQVRAGETEATATQETAFWFMVANETKTEWSWQLLFDRGEWFFGKGQLPRNFEAAKPGDLIFGYMASPQRQIVALARVEGSLETREEEDGGSKEGILIKPLTMLAHPLHWHKFVAHPLLKNSEPMKMNARGSMFKLTVDEARALADLLKAEGNHVTLSSDERGDFAEFVTFHQSFAYEEFVEGLKPVLSLNDEAGGVEYEIKRGVFREICARAEAAWRVHGEDAPKHLLVIDEINRANIAKVLGELITLIEDDKRLGEANELTVRLPASGERFGVPPNLYVLGTMNTADRSIALLDLALRRRFTFVEMTPQPSVIEPPVVAGVDLRALLARLNERIVALRDRDHQIGHSYFLRLTNADDLHFAWYRRVVPLLQEYFYNDGERLKAVIGGRFVRPLKMLAGDAALKELYDAEQPPYEVIELRGDEFIEAMRALAGTAEEAQNAAP